MAGKGGGAWKVAYADFVTAMMAFFLVMWLVSQSKPVKEAVAQYFRDPFGTAGSPGGPPVAIARPDAGGLSNLKAPPKGPRGYGKGTMKSEAKALFGSALRGAAPLEGSQEPGIARVGTTIVFQEESADLDNQAKSTLEAMAPALLGKPNKIEIRGHATGRPLPPDSPFADAWQLSYARCQGVYKFLVQQGVEAHRMRLSQAGSYEPQEQPGNADWMTHNSRVEVYMLGEFSNAVQKPAKRKVGRVLNGEKPDVAETPAP